MLQSSAPLAAGSYSPPALHWLRSPALDRPTHAAVQAVASWRWPIVYSLILMLLIELPCRMATMHLANGAYFVGMFWSPHDAAQYFSAMRQGTESASWLIYDRFSHEPH